MWNVWVKNTKAYIVLVGKPEEADVGRWLILQWTLKKQNGREWTGFIWLRKGTRVSCYEHGNEPLGYTNFGKFDTF